MDLNEKILIADKVLFKLNEKRYGQIPELIGRPSSPEEDSKYRIIEDELIKMGLAKKIGGGDNSTIGGFLILEIKPKGLNLVLQEKSIKVLYSDQLDKTELENKIQALQLEELEYKRTIRDQEQRIRDLTEKTKFIKLVKGYWWILITFFPIGYLIGKLMEQLF